MISSFCQAKILLLKADPFSNILLWRWFTIESVLNLRSPNFQISWVFCFIFLQRAPSTLVHPTGTSFRALRCLTRATTTAPTAPGPTSATRRPPLQTTTTTTLRTSKSRRLRSRTRRRRTKPETNHLSKLRFRFSLLWERKKSLQKSKERQTEVASIHTFIKKK